MRAYFSNINVCVCEKQRTSNENIMKEREKEHVSE